MRSPVTALISGLLVWAVVFAVALAIFPLRLSDRPLFESIMPVALTASTAFAGTLYFRRVEKAYASEGLLLGTTWLAVNLALDLVMFSRGPMQMSLVEYFGDIGITYLIIPCVTVGFGACLEHLASSPRG